MLRSFSYCILVVATLGCGPSGTKSSSSTTTPTEVTQPTQPAPPSFQGLFVKKTPEYSSYLLIGADGTACSVSLNDGTPEQVKAVFHCGANGIPKGPYQITGDTLRFTAASAEGSLDYEVVRAGNDLQVKTHSHVNDKHFEDTYVRVP
jgi:hypothetical protein